MTIEEFIEKWQKSGAAERANCQTFLNELCAIIGTAQPNPTSGASANDTYVYERAVKDPLSGTTKFIDLYKRGCFVLEAKQGSEKKQKLSNPLQHELLTGEARPEQTKIGTAVRGTPGWAKAMESAKRQAYNYARALDTAEGWPPFLIVVDIGHVIEIYSDFSGIGKNYTQFQDGRRFRITLEDLHDEEVRQTLKQIWEDPHSLDPSKHSAKVTRQIAERLAALGKSFQEQGHDSKLVARFLMRCLFTMFAEDVELIPKDSFSNLLIELRDNTESVKPSLENLWEVMDKGGFSPVLKNKLLRFNGGLFKESAALPVNNMQLSLLIDAASADWGEVEPAIFGTLLERALSTRDRHKLGAHYTPRAYVERLVTVTIVEPLRADWDAVKAAAFHLADKGDQKGAIKTVQGFHHELCTIRVLDPACGSGNFLYVALEMMKRLEGEVLDVLTELGETQARLSLSGETVDPQQFLGIELNPWAANVAELVLWIGYLQWHFRTFGNATPGEPVLKDFLNIIQGDAILSWSSIRTRLDDDGKPLTKWDGEHYKLDPASGEEIPDTDFQESITDYVHPKRASWPPHDFVVGNPPFTSSRDLRQELGDGYVDALRVAYPDHAHNSDFVTWFWDQSIQHAAHSVRRIGFVSTARITLPQNRSAMTKLTSDSFSFVFAIPDHPWYEDQDSADVRVALAVVERGNRKGLLIYHPTHQTVHGRASHRLGGRRFDRIHIGSALSHLPDSDDFSALKANSGLNHAGVKPYGQGFLVDVDVANRLFGSKILNQLCPIFLNGDRYTRRDKSVRAIDVNQFDTADELAAAYPRAYAYLLDHVKPKREQERNEKLKINWWKFEANRDELRRSLSGLSRFIVTLENSPDRYFEFSEFTFLPDQKIRVIASDSSYILGVLSSKIHERYSLRLGSRAGKANTPVYNSYLFQKFPFPGCTPNSNAAEHIALAAERLDAGRKAVINSKNNVSMTDIYGLIHKYKAAQLDQNITLSVQEKSNYESWEIALILDAQRRLDQAVSDAYGWPAELSDEEIVGRLVGLSREREFEEIDGHVRWLRPDYQNPGGDTQASKTGELSLEKEVQVEGQYPWPKELPEQMSLIRAVLADLGSASVEDVRKQFKRGQGRLIRERLETLAMLGQAEKIDEDKYAA